MATEGGDERGGMRRHRIAAIPAGTPAHQRDVALLPSGWNSSTLTSGIIAGFAGRV
jgi:hypothetical protein